MQDAITSVINSSDVQGKYLDTSAMERQLATSKLVNCEYGLLLSAPTRLRSSSSGEVSAVPDITRPGGNMYTTRRYAACIRDLDYYRYFYLCNAGR